MIVGQSSYTLQVQPASSLMGTDGAQNSYISKIYLLSVVLLFCLSLNILDREDLNYLVNGLLYISYSYILNGNYNHV